MTSDETINKYIRDALNIIINDPNYLVIKADQDSPRPSIPYCTVKIISSKGAALEEFTETNTLTTDVAITTESLREILVSFDFFKRGIVEHDPFYVANLCRQGLYRRSVNDLLTSNGLGLNNRSSIRNMTFKLDSGFEERANFTATFSFVDVDIDTSTSIGTVTINGEYQYETKNTPVNLTVSE